MGSIGGMDVPTGSRDKLLSGRAPWTRQRLLKSRDAYSGCCKLKNRHVGKLEFPAPKQGRTSSPLGHFTWRLESPAAGPQQISRSCPSVPSRVRCDTLPYVIQSAASRAPGMISSLPRTSAVNPGGFISTRTRHRGAFAESVVSNNTHTGLGHLLYPCRRIIQIIQVYIVHPTLCRPRSSDSIRRHPSSSATTGASASQNFVETIRPPTGTSSHYTTRPLGTSATTALESHLRTEALYRADNSTKNLRGSIVQECLQSFAAMFCLRRYAPPEFFLQTVWVSCRSSMMLDPAQVYHLVSLSC